MPGYHDTTYSPNALWQLNGSLLDSSGNGLTLGQSRGASRFGEMIPGFRGYTSIGSLLSELSRPSTDAGLLLLGDSCSRSHRTRCHKRSRSHTESRSRRRRRARTSQSGRSTYLVWKQAGATFSTTWHFPPYQPIHLYATRISQVVRFYVNGRKVATSGTLTTPTGNGTSRFYIQANNSVGYNGGTGFCSLKVTPSGLSDAQVLAEHNLTLGQVFAL
jgi:hypothetical protein